MTMKPIYAGLVSMLIQWVFTLSLFAQQRVLLPRHQRDKAVALKDGYQTNPDPAEPATTGLFKRERSITESEVVVGKTRYDLQSPGSLANRLCRFDDGTIAAVWTIGFNDPSFPDRGTGYNYYDGLQWMPPPSGPIEPERCGSPSLAPWGAGGEIVVSHNLVDGLRISRRAAKGSGPWEYLLLQGPSPFWMDLVYPKICSSGSNHEYLHVLAITLPVSNGGNIYMGQDAALLYSRSSDGGVTWNLQNIQLPGTDSSYYNGIYRDGYAWAEPRDSIIAFAVFDCWSDCFVMKSCNNGETWDKIMVWEHPYPFFDWDSTLTTDTLWAPDRSGDISLDHDGNVHLVCGLTRVQHFDYGSLSLFYFPYTDGIAYWNESMPPFTDPNGNQHDALDAEDVLVEDYNLIGWTHDFNGNGIIEFEEDLMTYLQLGISTMPNIDINDQGVIQVVYASTTETYSNGTYNYKHIWKRRSPDNGTTWGNFIDITGDVIHIFDECIYPVLITGEQGSLFETLHYCLYQTDADPGLAVLGNTPYSDNSINFYYDPVVDIGNHQINDNLKISQNHPNPFTGETTLYIDYTSHALLQITITDMMGKVVHRQVFTVPAGGRKKVVIDGSGFSPGLFLCRVTADGAAASIKMVRGR